MPGTQDDDDDNSDDNDNDGAGNPSRCRGDDRFAKPMVEETTAIELFALLRQLNVQSGAGNLVEVSLHAGDWTRPWDGPMYGGAGRLGTRTAWTKCWIETAGGHGEEDTARCSGYAHDIVGNRKE